MSHRHRGMPGDTFGSASGTHSSSESQQDLPDRIPKVFRTVSVAVLLFVVGSLMIYFGVQALNEEGGRERGISMCTVGAIAFLPGSYATWHLYGAFRNWPGYTYDMVPSYDE